MFVTRTYKLVSLKVNHADEFALFNQEQTQKAAGDCGSGFSYGVDVLRAWRLVTAGLFHRFYKAGVAGCQLLVVSLIVSFIVFGGSRVVSAEERSIQGGTPLEVSPQEVPSFYQDDMVEETPLLIDPLPQDMEKSELVKPDLAKPGLTKPAPLDRAKKGGAKKRALSSPHLKEKQLKGKQLSPLRQALKDYRAKRIKKAISGLELAAEKNSFFARYLLAHIYRTGKGVVINHRRAFQYYREIATEFSKNGEFDHSRKAPYIAQAFVQLARYMEDGVAELDIKADPLMARVLFEKAAHFGDIEGQYQLGRFLIESGKMRNVKLGQQWLTRAAMKNNPKAQAYLGALYWQGDLITQKKSLALAWIEFARRNATGSVKKQVERLYRAVRFDTSQDVHNRAEFYIGRLRTKYNVLWREEPKRADENDILDGIILADPPKDLDEDQLENKAHKNQMPDAMVTGPEYFMDGGPSVGLGMQMYDYGGAAGR